MANTVSLNSDDSVYVTTFYGGEERGRCYTITVNSEKGTVPQRAFRTVTEEELFSILGANQEGSDGLVVEDNGERPLFDNRSPFGAPRRPFSSYAQRTQNARYVVDTLDSGNKVLAEMLKAIDKDGVVSVEDLNELVGMPSTHIDHKWGWKDLSTAGCRQVREGYLLDLPQTEEI